MMRMKAKIETIIHKEGYRKLGNVFTRFFLVFLAVYVAFQTLLTTNFSTAFLMGIGGVLCRVLFWFVLLKSCFELGNWRELLPAALTALCYQLVYRSTGYGAFPFYALIVMGTVGIEYRRILKMQVALVGGVVLAAVAAAFAGMIPNLVYLYEGGLRDSFGILYPTDFASCLFYLLILFWIAWKNLPDWLSLLLCAGFFLVARCYARSDTSSICGILFAGVLSGFLLVKKFCKEGKTFGKAFRSCKKTLDGILILAFPLCALLMFGLLGLYAADVPPVQKLNQILTGRLALACRSLSDNGVRLFGVSISQLGAGATTFPVAGYNFVDSSYPLILIRCGWVLFLVIAFCWVRVTYLAVKGKDYRLAFGMGLIAFHSLSEHHFLDVGYNILLVMPFAVYAQPAREEAERTQAGRTEKLPAGMICGAAVLLAALLTEPFWMAYFRTVCGWMCLTDLNMRQLFAAGFALLFAALTALLIRSLAGCVRTFRAGEKRGRAFWLLPAALLGLAAAMALTAGLVKRASADCQARLEADAPAMRVILNSAEGKVCADELPVLYRQTFGNIHYPVFMGEDLARYRDTTVVVSRSKEYICFLRRGFQYAAISEYSAVYTNDAGVIQSLSEAGYAPKNYYDEIRYIELPLWSAPTVDLRAGEYTVRLDFQASLPESADTVAQIKIVGNYGRDMLLEESISRDGADEEGNVETEFLLEISGDTAGVKFYLLPENGAALETREISYRMNRPIQEP